LAIQLSSLEISFIRSIHSLGSPNAFLSDFLDGPIIADLVYWRELVWLRSAHEQLSP
jgi:hypothetical protein